MTEKMLGRVARAICDSDNLPDDNGSDYEYNPGYWQKAARAAIEALMETTPGMVEKFDPVALRLWQAMLRAVLEEGDD